MTASGFERCEELFQVARRLEGESRDAYLASQCAGDSALREEVEALLRAHETERDRPILPDEIFRLDSDRSSAPRIERLGRFRILETLGAGGMGVVFLAEQDHPRRVVALKVMRPGLVSDEARRRFLREAQALGQLRHPGIAQVFDAGVEDGVPYIAMERIEGRSLITFADAEGLSREERLELLARICDAVQHAHDHGVIHRDLKPSNVLVEGSRGAARPIVVDFGVARVVGPAAPATQVTGQGELLGTLSYMSPEQAGGRPDGIDERTDVHALGVMLFELLTGKLPRDLFGLPVLEAARRLTDEDPTTASSVDPSLAGDLDTVLATAIAREAGRRYPSAGALAADLRCVLRDEPIAARAPSAIDHLRKFARRHRSAAIGTAIVLFTIMVGFAATAWQWRRAVAEKEKAEKRFDQLRRLAGAFMFDLNPKLTHVPGALEARRTIVRTGLEYLDQLAAEAPEDATLRLELASAYQKMGDIQGGATLANLGDFDGALANYRKAEAILLELEASGRDSGASHADLAVIELRIGDAIGTLQGPRAALDEYRRVERRIARWSAEAPGDARITSLSADHAERSGNALLALGRVEDARALYLVALRCGRERAASDPEDPALRRNVSVSLTKLANCAAALGDRDEALALLEEANRDFRAIAETTPENALARRDLAVTEERIGRILVELERASEAEPHFRLAMEASEAAVAADPVDVQARLDLAVHCCRFGELRLAAGAIDEAESHFTRYLEVAANLVEENPNIVAARRDLGVAHYKFAEVARAREHAASDSVSKNEQAERIVAALERSLSEFRRLEADGALSAEDVGVPADLESELRIARLAVED